MPPGERPPPRPFGAAPTQYQSREATQMIDLKATYGDRYRITLDESARAPGTSRLDKLWCYRIPCRYGHVFVHGVNTLGASADRSRISARLCALPGVLVRQRGDSEASVTFPPELLPQVAQLLRARRRRRLTPEQAAAGAARLAALRASKAKQGATSGA